MSKHMSGKAALTGGVSYYPDHWPEEEWARDLTLIKQSGLDLIRFGEFSWHWIEPREGEFTFEGYDRFMDLAAELELKVVLCTPTAAPPSWLLHRYPHVRLIDQHGRSHPGGRHMICYNDPVAKALAERLITKLALRYREHPALLGWQIDNEPTSGESLSAERIYDYHPETVKLFREYLCEQYGTVKRLNDSWVNAFWSRSYNEWEEIEPPQAPGIPGLWLAWMKFRDLNVTRFIRWQRDLLREVDPQHVIGTNIPEVGTVESCWLAQDYWAQCEGLDYAGIDMYVFARNPMQEKRALAFSSDLIGAAAAASQAEFWVSETQGGPHRLPWRMTFVGGLWGTDFLRESTNTFAAHGAVNIFYFLWRPLHGGQEFGMNGLVGFDGAPNEITLAVPDILREAQPERDALAGRPDVYVHYSRDSLLLASGFDPDPTMDTSLRGWHALLTEWGYRVRFLNDEQLASRNWVADDICLLPYTTVMDSGVTDSLNRADAAGARVLAGFSYGYFNERGTIAIQARMPELIRLFGVRPQGFDQVPAAAAPAIESLADVKLSDVLRTQLALDKGAEVKLRTADGEPLVILQGRHGYVAFDAGTCYGRLAAEAQLRLGPVLRQAMGL